MRAYVQTLAGVHLNTQGARAAQGFRELGVECVEFLDDEDLEDIRREDILCAGERLMSRRMASLGISSSVEPNPEALRPYLGRRLWRAEAADLTDADLPLFLVPVRDGDFHALVATDRADLAASGVRGGVWASEVVWFAAVWRAFVRYGQVVAILPAEGDLELVVDERVVRDAARAWKGAPAAFAIDFGVDETGRTLVVRARDVWGLSPLGLDARGYALLLAARWAELAGVEDTLREVCLG